MVWMRGMQRDYDGWAENGAKGLAFADLFPVFKKQAVVQMRHRGDRQARVNSFPGLRCVLKRSENSPGLSR